MTKKKTSKQVDAEATHRAIKGLVVEVERLRGRVDNLEAFNRSIVFVPPADAQKEIERRAWWNFWG
jgi:hypothetical protein